MPQGQAGERVLASEFADKTVHMSGSFSGSASGAMRGSCKENPNAETAGDWFNLGLKYGVELSGTEAFGAVILENPLWLSPLVTGGDGSTAINFDITLKKGT